MKALYPSINPEFALIALEDALEKNTSLSQSNKEMLHSFTKYILFNQFVNYKGISYKGKKGMATGGSSSRQCADIFLSWLIFQKENCMSNIITLWENVVMWVRFIDDVFGVWDGSNDLFQSFIQQLNRNCEQFGIEYDKWESGTSVNFLDTSCYFAPVLEGEVPQIQHKLYRKPTDARRFLKPDSHHPKHIFPATVKSQMKRIMRLNSLPEQRDEDLNGLTEDLVRNGYNISMIASIREELATPIGEEQQDQHVSTQDPKPTLIFNVEFFSGLGDLKNAVRNLGEDIATLVGHQNITFATRKGPTIGSKLVKNGQLCKTAEAVKESQKCGRKNCKTCPAMIDTDTITVNGHTEKLPKNVDCKSKGVIYVQTCSACDQHNSYVGQTRQEFRERNNGHRVKFNMLKHEDSALAHHSYQDHGLGVKMKDFVCAIVKKCKIRQLDREEFKFIERFKTLTKGLNRCKIINSK